MNEEQIPTMVDDEAEDVVSFPDIVDNTEENARKAEEEAERPVDTRSAAERIEALFDEMRTERKILLGILSFCGEGRTEAEVNAEISRLTESHVCVYSPASLYRMLEKSGAIAHEGGDVENEPELVEIGGVEYLKPTEAEPVVWTTSAEGLAYLEADAPATRLREVVEGEPQYAGVYRIVLERTAQDGGATTPELDEAVDGDPAVQEPRRFAEYFFEKLEDCDAIRWTGEAWAITGIGRDCLAELRAETKEADAA